MWWAGSFRSHRADVYLGTRQVRLRYWGRDLLQTECMGIADGLQRLPAVLGSLPKRCRLRVWLSGGLCRPFLLPAIEGVTSDEEWKQVADSLVGEGTGLQGSCRVWLDPKQRQPAPALAVALEEARMQQLFAVIPAKRIESLQPWWAEALRVRSKNGGERGAMVVRDCDALTVLLAEGEDFVHAQSYPGDAGGDQSVLDRTLIAAAWSDDVGAIVRLGGADDAEVAGASDERNQVLVFAAAGGNA